MSGEFFANLWGKIFQINDNYWNNNDNSGDSLDNQNSLWGSGFSTNAQMWMFTSQRHNPNSFEFQRNNFLANLFAPFPFLSNMFASWNFGNNWGGWNPFGFWMPTQAQQYYMPWDINNNGETPTNITDNNPSSPPPTTETTTTTPESTRRTEGRSDSGSTTNLNNNGTNNNNNTSSNTVRKDTSGPEKKDPTPKPIKDILGEEKTKSIIIPILNGAQQETIPLDSVDLKITEFYNNDPNKPKAGKATLKNGQTLEIKYSEDGSFELSVLRKEDSKEVLKQVYGNDSKLSKTIATEYSGQGTKVTTTKYQPDGTSLEKITIEAKNPGEKFIKLTEIEYHNDGKNIASSSETVYDENGNPETKVETKFTPDKVRKESIYTEYTYFGEKVTTTKYQPDGNLTETVTIEEKDKKGIVIGIIECSVSYKNDTIGNKTEIWTINGKTSRTKIFNKDGKLLKETEHSSAGNIVTEYDADGGYTQTVYAPNDNNKIVRRITVDKNGLEEKTIFRNGVPFSTIKIDKTGVQTENFFDEDGKNIIKILLTQTDGKKTYYKPDGVTIISEHTPRADGGNTETVINGDIKTELIKDSRSKLIGQKSYHLVDGNFVLVKEVAYKPDGKIVTDYLQTELGQRRTVTKYATDNINKISETIYNPNGTTISTKYQNGTPTEVTLTNQDGTKSVTKYEKGKPVRIIETEKDGTIIDTKLKNKIRTESTEIKPDGSKIVRSYTSNGKEEAKIIIFNPQGIRTQEILINQDKSKLVKVFDNDGKLQTKSIKLDSADRRLEEIIFRDNVPVSLKKYDINGNVEENFSITTSTSKNGSKIERYSNTDGKYVKSIQYDSLGRPIIEIYYESDGTTIQYETKHEYKSNLATPAIPSKPEVQGIPTLTSSDIISPQKITETYPGGKPLKGITDLGNGTKIEFVYEENGNFVAQYFNVNNDVTKQIKITFENGQIKEKFEREMLSYSQIKETKIVSGKQMTQSTYDIITNDSNLPNIDSPKKLITRSDTRIDNNVQTITEEISGIRTSTSKVHKIKAGNGELSELIILPSGTQIKVPVKVLVYSENNKPLKATGTIDGKFGQETYEILYDEKTNTKTITVTNPNRKDSGKYVYKTNSNGEMLENICYDENGKLIYSMTAKYTRTKTSENEETMTVEIIQKNSNDEIEDIVRTERNYLDGKEIKRMETTYEPNGITQKSKTLIENLPNNIQKVSIFFPNSPNIQKIVYYDATKQISKEVFTYNGQGEIIGIKKTDFKYTNENLSEKIETEYNHDPKNDFKEKTTYYWTNSNIPKEIIITRQDGKKFKLEFDINGNAKTTKMTAINE